VIVNRLGKAKLAARIAFFVVLLTATLLVFEARDGFRSHAMLVFPGLLLISVMLMDRASYRAAAGLVLLAVAALGVADKKGLTRFVPGARTSASYASIFYVDLNLLVIAFIGSRIAREAQSNVLDLRASIEQLSRANIELTATAEELREREQQLISIYNSVRDIIFQLAVEAGGRFRFVSVNEAFLKITGLSREAVVGKTVNQVIPEPSLTMVLGKYRQAIEEKTSVLWEETSDYPAGQLTGAVSVVPVFDDKGTCTHLIGSFHDMTAQKRAEQVIREGEQRLRIAKDAAKLGIYEYDVLTGNILWDARIRQLWGMDSNVPISIDTFFSGLHPEDHAKTQAVLDRALDPAGNGEYYAEYRVISRADGTERWVAATGQVFFEDGRAGRMIGTGQDISERKRAEAQVRESEERFRKIFEEGPLGLALVGDDYGFFKVNRALCQMVGYSEAELLQMSFPDLTSPDDLQADLALAERLFAGEIPSYRIQKRYVKKNGEIIWINLTAALLRDEEGEPTHELKMIEDITDFKHSQEEAFARQKLESVGLLARGIAHDFNNLLGGVVVEAEVAEAEWRAGDSPLETIQRLRTAAMRGAEIVRELMVYSGQDSAEPVEAINLSTLVEEMLELLRTSIPRQVALHHDLDGNIPSVLGRASQLRQIVMNLIINGSEAIGPKAGTIAITTSPASLPRTPMIVSPPKPASGGYLKLEVSDNGIGMSKEVQAKIFDPFFSTKSTGRGLGLAVVERIVRDYEGAIKLMSIPGQGTTFEIYFPSIGETTGRTASAARVADKVHRARSGTVLIVEDEEALRFGVATLLGRGGFEVIEASDGSSALELIRSSRGIDLLLLDMTLPGVSSREVLDEAQRCRSNLKVILTSAYSKETVDAFFAGARTEGFIRKPFQFHDLITLVEEALSN
jgi:PAS domain S-box-containing protein